MTSNDKDYFFSLGIISVLRAYESCNIGHINTHALFTPITCKDLLKILTVNILK